MTWTPENVIAAAATGVALVSVIVTAVVSVVTARTSVRLQQREAAVSRRRDVHLRFWRSANRALRLLQERHSSMGQPDVNQDEPEPDELDDVLGEARAAHVELEIVSPAIADRCSRILVALDLSRMEVQNLAEARRLTAAGARGILSRPWRAARSELDTARRGLNDVQRLMAAYEERGRLPTWRPRLARWRRRWTEGTILRRRSDPSG